MTHSAEHPGTECKYNLSRPIYIARGYISVNRFFSPLNRQIIQFEFCVSLKLSTTSSERKKIRFDKMEVNDFEILLIDVTNTSLIQIRSLHYKGCICTVRILAVKWKVCVVTGL